MILSVVSCTNSGPEVTKNGNSWVSVPQTAQENGTSVTKITSILIQSYTDAKTMVAAIETLLRYSLRLSSGWIFVWMNKAEIETMSINDLYNNFKIVEQSVKKSIGASSGAQNLAFMTAPVTSSTNNVNTAKPAYENPNGSNLLQQDLEQIHKDDLEEMDLKWQLSLLSIRVFNLVQKLGGGEGTTWDVGDHQGTRRVLYKIKDNTRKHGKTMKTHLQSNFKQEKEGIEFKIEKFDKASKDLDKLLGSQITDKSKKGLGYNDVPPPHPLIYNRPKKLDLSYSGLDEFKELNQRLCSEVSVSRVSKIVEFVKPKNHEKPVKKSVRYAEMYRSQTPRGNQRNWNGQKSNQLGINIAKAQAVNTARPKTVNTTRPKAVNTARPNFAIVNAVRVNQGKPQQDDTGFVDSRCSRHMTGNITYLSDFMEFDGGFVTFWGSEIFEQLALMGYVTTFDSLTFQKGDFSLQWKFFIHTILHCLSPKKTAWEQFSSNIATAIICLATNITFNFLKFIFDATVKNLDSTRKFLINRREALKGFSKMITPLFDTMLVQHQDEEPSIQTTPETSSSKITSSPSLSSHHTSISSTSTSQPPITLLRSLLQLP
ncbi:hypothetical protein Tco_1541197 [Tanacetum coccineum]